MRHRADWAVCHIMANIWEQACMCFFLDDGVSDLLSGSAAAQANAVEL